MAFIRKKKKLGSYPAYSVVFSLSLALFVIGLFGLLVLQARKLSDIIKEKIEMHVYMQYDVADSTKLNLVRNIHLTDYLAIKDDKKQLYYISKEKAAEKFIKETGEDFVKFLGENPLRDAYTMKISSKFASKESLTQIKKYLDAQTGVFEVVYVESLIDAINNNLRIITIVLLSFAFILIISVFLLMSSTIKLAIFSQRLLIRSMKLIGARNSFIVRPFLTRGFIHGVFSGIISILMLLSLLFYGNYHFPELVQLQDFNEMIFLGFVIIIFGGLIGITSSYIAVKNYINTSLDDLY